MQANFTSPKALVDTSTTPWSELDEPPSPLEFLVAGTGEVTLAVLLNFVPAEPLAFPTYRGIYVEQVIQFANQSSSFDDPVGSPLDVIPLGSIVIVTVQVIYP